MSSSDSDFDITNAESDMSEVESDSSTDSEEIAKEIADLTRDTPTPSEAEDLEEEEDEYMDPESAYNACVGILTSGASKLDGRARAKYISWMGDIKESIETLNEFSAILANLDGELSVVPDRRLAKVYREFVGAAEEYLSDSLTELPKVIRKCVDRQIKKILEA